MVMSSLRTLMPVVSALVISLFSARAFAQPCEYRWTKGWFGLPNGADQPVTSLSVLNGREGPTLCFGGRFSAIGDVVANHIASFDGATWNRLGNGERFTCSAEYCLPSVTAAVLFDDGLGPALYICGRFDSIGGQLTNHIAKWDGTAWAPLSIGLKGDPSSYAGDMLVFDGGSGAALYVGGHFLSAGPVGAVNVAKWDGRTWSAVGSGLGEEKKYSYETVAALEILGTGSAATLYAGGRFWKSGETPLANIARWDGSEWVDVGGGVSGGGGYGEPIRTLLASSAFGPPKLYAAGSFVKAGEIEAMNVAAWDGVGWCALGAGLGGPPGTGTSTSVAALAEFDFGEGATLVASYGGGYYSQLAGGLAKFDGVSWSIVGYAQYSADRLVAFEDEFGPALYVAGYFKQLDDMSASNIAKWQNGSWHAVSAPFPHSVDGTVSSLVRYDSGRGGSLFVIGELKSVGGMPPGGIARWDGSRWQEGPVLPAPYEWIGCLAALKEGDDEALFVGSVLGGSGAALKWNGATWARLSGFPGAIRQLASYDGGAGPQLYATSWAPNFMGRWDYGASWTLVSIINSAAHARAFAVHDDSSGAALYIGGKFSMPTSNGLAQNLARWDGAKFSQIGNVYGAVGGLVPEVYALQVFHEGSDDVLFVGGHFSTAGNNAIPYLARWNGKNWSSVGGGVNGMVGAMTVLDEGIGPRLIVAGKFTTADGKPMPHIARWDGSEWAAVGGGLDGAYVNVSELELLQDGVRQSLYAAGEFTSAGGNLSVNFARYAYQPVSCPGDLDLNGVVDAKDLGILLADYGCTSGCVGDTDCDDDTDQSDLGALLKAFGTHCEP